MLVPADLPTAQIECAKEILRYPSHPFILPPDLLPNEAQVIRIRQRIGPDVIGGYSVALLK